jgi:uncharacterized protein (DUF427 family)
MKITNLRGHVTVDPGGDHAHVPATGRVRAVWNGAVLAESDRTIVIEGNHYFPVRDVAFELLAPSDARSTCPWKGEASYLDVVVKDERNPAAAWSYPDPKPVGVQICDHVAFWQGVEIHSASGAACSSASTPVSPRVQSVAGRPYALNRHGLDRGLDSHHRRGRFRCGCGHST